MRRTGVALLLAAAAAGVGAAQYHCREGGLRGEELLAVENVTGAAACQGHCDAVPACGAVAMLEDTCVLHGAAAVHRDADGIACTRTAAFACQAGKALPNGVFTVANVASLEDCQRQCAAFSEVCTGVNFASSLECELVSGATDVFTEADDPQTTACAVQKPPAAAAAAGGAPMDPTVFKCAQSAVLADGAELLLLSNVRSVDECARYCDEVPGCSGFALSGNGECQLRTGDVTVSSEGGGGRAAVVGCVRDDKYAGLAGAEGSGGEPYTCSDDAAAYTGGDLAVVTHASAAGCKAWCTLLPACSLFVLSRSGACVLKRDTAAPSNATHPPTFTTRGLSCEKDNYRAESKQTDPTAGFGAFIAVDDDSAAPIDVSTEFQCVENALYGGALVAQFPRETDQTCMTLCLQHPGCEACATNDVTCALLKAVSVAPNPSALQKGNRVCTKRSAEEVAGYRCTRAKAYTGATARLLQNVESSTACAESCTEEPGCVVAVFDPSTRLCHLKTLHSTPAKSALETSTACLHAKVDVRHGYHCTRAFSMSGAVVSLLSNVPLAQCKEQCDLMAECATIQHTKATQTCELLSRAAVVERPRVIEANGDGAIVCGKPWNQAAQENALHGRAARVLAANDGQTRYIGHSKVRFGLSINGLTEETFKNPSLAAAAGGGGAAGSGSEDAEETSLWFTAHFRVPVGMHPTTFGWTVFYQLAHELHQAHNVFMEKVNPLLSLVEANQYLSAGVGGRWSLKQAGAEWVETTTSAIEIPMFFAPSDDVDLVADTTRLALARYLAATLSLPASTASTSAIYFCSDANGLTCTLVWSAAESDTAGGAASRFQTLADDTAAEAGSPTTIKLDVVMDITGNTTKEELCAALEERVCKPGTPFADTFHLTTCGICAAAVYGSNGPVEGDDTPADAPLDAPFDQSARPSRRLLQLASEAASGLFAGAKLPSPAEARRAAAALATRGDASTGLPRQCVAGWQEEAYGLISTLFDVKTEAGKSTVVTGTLNECAEACSPNISCTAFTRDSSVSEDDSSPCTLKSTVPPVSGDLFVPPGSSLRTFVVLCPTPAPPCQWATFEDVDLRGEGAQPVATAYTGTTAECKMLCGLLPGCTAVAFERLTGLCSFLEAVGHSTMTGSETVHSAICSRVGAAFGASACNRGFCGTEKSSVCLPLSLDSYSCACASGFGCSAQCGGPLVPKTCEQRSTLHDEFVHALSLALNLDERAIFLTDFDVLSGEGQPAVNQTTPPPPTTPEDPVVVVHDVGVNLAATHIFSIVLSGMPLVELFEPVPDAKLKYKRIHFLADTIFEDLVGSAEVSVESICQVYPDGDTGSCVTIENSDVAVETRPVVKVSAPARDHQSAVDWCLGASPVFLAEPPTAEALEKMVFSARGQVVETRRYWVGAQCDENCADPAEWSWAMKQAAVNWTSLGLSDPQAGHGCALAAYEPYQARWGVVSAPCDSKGAYPLCIYSSALPANDHAEECADDECGVKITLRIPLDHVRDVSFVALPDGTTVKYHPTIDLPAGAQLLTPQGVSMGYVHNNGKTTAIKYPPVDQPLHAALLDVMPSVTYVSEALSEYMSHNLPGWLEMAGLGKQYDSACHEGVESMHVKCSGFVCAAYEPLIVRRTSCSGSPPCLDAGCSGNGYASGFIGHCSCTCERGFTGPSCGQCAPGYSNYPACVEAEGQADIDLQMDLIHMRFRSSPDNVANNHESLRDDLTTAIAFLSDSFEVRFVCPATACDDCTTPVASWPADSKGQCQKQGIDFGLARRSIVSLASARGYFPLVDDDESTVEVLVTFDALHSHHPTEASDLLISTLRTYLNQGSGTFGSFLLTDVRKVFGPSTVLDAPLPPASVTPVEPPVEGPSKESGAGVSILPEASSGVNVVLLIAIVVSALFVCLALSFLAWKRRQYLRRRRKKTKELLKKYGNDEDAGDDVVVITKHPDEPMGVLWDDHTLLVGVCEGSPASLFEVDKFKNRRIAKINGKEVHTLTDIRWAAQGESVVTLEFEPRFSTVVVRIQATADNFDEHAFLQSFADKIARALDLADFTEMDLDLQSMVERIDRGELLLSVKLLGLTSEQVARVVAMCVTPGDPIRAGLPVVGAYLASAKGSHMSPPLWVCSQWLTEAAYAAGCYMQVPTEQEEGFPVWQHIPADHWMYSCAGYWVVVDDKDLIGQDIGSQYILKSCVPHRGAAPHVITEWRTPHREDPHIIVSEEEPTAGEFVIGQKVVFPCDVELGEDGACVCSRAEGLVMGEAEDGLIRICLLNDSFDVVTVSSDVIDSPDGPRALYLLENRWMPCALVKVRQEEGRTMLKLHFDCGFCTDRWIDREDEADNLQISEPQQFAVGDHVQLSLEAPAHLEEDGCLSRDDMGIIVACGDLGQATPFLVEGPTEIAWYAGCHLSHVAGATIDPRATVPNPFAAADDNTAADYNATCPANDPYGNDEEGQQVDEGE